MFSAAVIKSPATTNKTPDPSSAISYKSLSQNQFLRKAPHHHARAMALTSTHFLSFFIGKKENFATLRQFPWHFRTPVKRSEVSVTSYQGSFYFLPKFLAALQLGVVVPVLPLLEICQGLFATGQVLQQVVNPLHFYALMW